MRIQSSEERRWAAHSWLPWQGPEHGRLRRIAQLAVRTADASRDHAQFANLLVVVRDGPFQAAASLPFALRVGRPEWSLSFRLECLSVGPFELRRGFSVGQTTSSRASEMARAFVHADCLVRTVRMLFIELQPTTEYLMTTNADKSAQHLRLSSSVFPKLGAMTASSSVQVPAKELQLYDQARAPIEKLAATTSFIDVKKVSDYEGILVPPETDIPALTDHPFLGPFLTASWNEVRCRALQRQVFQLETELGSDHPQIALVRSWYAVSHGAECFQESLLKTLREAEPVIRVHYPEAHRALAMNLAAQGCHVRALRKRDQATGPLASAFHLMMIHDVAVEADIVKVAELLADCYSACGAFDDALFILYTAQQFIPGAVEQSELIASQCEEFRERFIDEHGHRCSQQYQGMVGALRRPGLRDSLS